jgi:FkbM family methyltransferase
MNMIELLSAWEQVLLQDVYTLMLRSIQYIPDDGVLLDIGANVGTFTACVLGQKEKINAVLFEPVSLYAAFCKKRFSQFPKVSVEPYALNDREGSIPFWMDATNLGWNTMISEEHSTQQLEVTVSTKTLDSYNFNRIDLMKIDVECAEREVFAGMHETIQRLEKKPVIVLELGVKHRGAEQLEWLFSNGYQRFDYNLSSQSDVIILPNGVSV